MINPTLLRNALDTLNFKPEIDLFASRLKRQFAIYCSFRSDLEASCIDAFTISPFSCILRVLRKTIQDREKGVLVVPMWPSHSWYPILTVTLPPSKNLLSLPKTAEINHPLHKKMSFLICLLSGNSSKALASPPDQ